MSNSIRAIGLAYHHLGKVVTVHVNGRASVSGVLRKFEMSTITSDDVRVYVFIYDDGFAWGGVVPSSALVEFR